LVSTLRQLGVGRRVAVAARCQLQARPRLLRLRRLGRRARGRRPLRAREQHDHRTPYWEVQQGRIAEPRPPSRPHHPAPPLLPAFGWFGFNPGSTLGASGAGNLRIGSIAVNTMLAGCTGSFGAIFYMWMRFGKPDASMSGNGLLAGLVAITAPSGFVSTVGAV